MAHHPVPLTPRETEVIELVQRGNSPAVIASEIGCSTSTVRHHIRSIAAKIGRENPQLARLTPMRAIMIWKGGVTATEYQWQRKVYFAQEERSKAIKIGSSINPAARINQLQAATPERIVLLATMPGGIDLEESLHLRFAKYQIHGEWFEAGPELLEFVAEVRSAELPTE